jgi:hypothetical protein
MLLIAWLALGGLCAVVWSRKGGNVWQAAVLGAIFGVFALIYCVVNDPAGVRLRKSLRTHGFPAKSDEYVWRPPGE